MILTCIVFWASDNTKLHRFHSRSYHCTSEASVQHSNNGEIEDLHDPQAHDKAQKYFQRES